MDIEHHGLRHRLDGAGLVQPIPTLVAPPAPHQPYGRAPSTHDQHDRGR
jgi:hypothetical protein